MNSVHVRRIAGEDRMRIRFTYCHNDLGKARIFNLDRLQSEDLATTLARLQANVIKYLAPKKRKKLKKLASNPASNMETIPQTDDINVALENEIPVKLHCNGKELESTLSNAEAWAEGHQLNIGQEGLTIELNPPCVTVLKLPESIMVGFPIYPKFTTEFAENENCLFTWYTSDSVSNQEGTPSSSKDKLKEEWMEVHQGYSYSPQIEDLGCQIKVKCIPQNNSKDRQGEPTEAVSKRTVEAGPGSCPFEVRHLYTTNHCGPASFRVMSYNILADLYADSDFSRDQLYPYCPPYALNIDYRKQLLMKEIKGYNADIICLQECDTKVFKSDFSPALSLDGYEGLHRSKNGEIPEGCSTFYRKSKFKFVAEHDVFLTEYFETSEECKDLNNKVSKNEVLMEKLKARHTTMQVTILEPQEENKQKLCVATTHLFFHPRSPNIRLLQAITCLRHLAKIKEIYGQDIPIIFCGDFNSTPDRGVYELVTKKTIPSNHTDLYAGGQEEFVSDLDLSHDIAFQSACGTPTYTNYVGGFSGCLDYIFISDMLGVNQVIPMQNHQDIILNSALPSVTFPSDHLALVCDLTWIDSS